MTPDFACQKRTEVSRICLLRAIRMTIPAAPDDRLSSARSGWSRSQKASARMLFNNRALLKKGALSYVHSILDAEFLMIGSPNLHAYQSSRSGLFGKIAFSLTFLGCAFLFAHE